MPDEPGRPYFKYSIVQLEEEYSQGKSDSPTLHTIDHELNYRSTDRAARLKRKVREALNLLRQGQSAPLANNPATSAEGRTTSPPQSSSHAEGQAPNNAPHNAQMTLDLGELPSFTPPQRSEEPDSILAAWIALEALTPQTYRRPEDMVAGDRRCIANLTNGGLPWRIGESSRPKYVLFYQIILGAIPMDRATTALVAAFGRDEEGMNRVREKAAIAAVLVDKNGLMVEENGIAVSSFAWALPLALELKLGALGVWPRIESKIIQSLEKCLRRFDDAGKPIPLDLPAINAAYHWLVAQFGLPNHLVEPPSFALRVYHYYKSKNPPEASLLNSFFLGDLAKAAELVKQNTPPTGLGRYLGIKKPTQTFDLLTDKSALEEAVAPKKMPVARWPSPGGHPLVLLQQAAVNLARSELAGDEGIIAVNGPPGTGKTTLLRDIVAACVCDRALSMAAFDDPQKAFTASGEKVYAGPNAFFHLYALAPSIKGHEIVVASSNNKAVENVSGELPALKAVGRTSEQLSYFKSISDFVHSPHDANEATCINNRSDVHVETWGMIAAVLGNAKNRAVFKNSFWWDDDHGFRTYLKAAKGDCVVRETMDQDSGQTIRHTPEVVLAEKPPLPQEAKGNWIKARDKFLLLKQEIDAELKALEDVRQLAIKFTEIQTEIAQAEADLMGKAAQRPRLELDVARCETEAGEAGQRHKRSTAEVQEHLQTRPGFFVRLFRTKRSQQWSQAHAPFEKAESEAANMLQKASQALSESTATLYSFTSKINAIEQSLAALRKRAAGLSGELEKHRRELGVRLVDEAFFAQGHQLSNLASPWMPDRLHRKREELFIAALAVHKAFIDCAAQKFYHNLSILMDVFSGKSLKNEAQLKFLGDLWSTLFLVIPVLSTTFASVDRMLGGLPVGSLGWLLIDEAGQALPQAAVGAMMRAKRTVAVGDPLQIPPVVTLPERLSLEVCKFFKVNAPLWVAPEASTQTLADRASRFQAVFQADPIPRRVGVPLLVHRRCQDPMFTISNRIAYDGQMVHAPGACRAGSLEAALGPSSWFDLDGEANDKWCPAEGDLVVELMKRIAREGLSDPDLFIITPFRIIANEMRRRLEREQQLFSVLKVDVHEWVNDRVGTIHTVQGREADSVILVLGAPNMAQHGARCWAAGTPNILNVAVSRAKQNLYVIGSRGAWAGIGHARELACIPGIRM
uniref:DNA2/NAM7 helicase-like C-terminal domain-containing protein n=1 Tax=Desulfovibrio sp. U5L TaxID=596152 RepID=I2Q4G1_9BACT